MWFMVAIPWLSLFSELNTVVMFWYCLAWKSCHVNMDHLCARFGSLLFCPETYWSCSFPQKLSILIIPYFHSTGLWSLILTDNHKPTALWPIKFVFMCKFVLKFFPAFPRSICSLQLNLLHSFSFSQLIFILVYSFIFYALFVIVPASYSNSVENINYQSPVQFYHTFWDIELTSSWGQCLMCGFARNKFTSTRKSLGRCWSNSCRGSKSNSRR